MYIDAVLGVIIWTVKWLYYLNCEAIPLISSICHEFVLPPNRVSLFFGSTSWF